MASTFGALTFQTERSGSTLPMQSFELNRGRQHVPGSNINIIDLGGQSERTFVRRIVVPSTDVDSWLNPGITEGQYELILNGTSYGPAVIGAIGEHEHEIEDGLDVDHFTVEWILIS